MPYQLYITFFNGRHLWNKYESEADAEIAIDHYAEQCDVVRIEFMELKENGALQWETVFKR